MRHDVGENARRSGSRRRATPVVRCPLAIWLALLLLAQRSFREAGPTVDCDVPSPAERVTLTFGGDVMFGRYRGQRWVANGGNDPFRHVAALMRSADLTVVNLESPLSDETPRDIRTSRRYARRGVRLRGPAAMAEVLAEAGTDVVSLANNHAEDCLRDGLRDTLAALRAAGIAAAGVALDGDPLDATSVCLDGWLKPSQEARAGRARRAQGMARSDGCKLTCPGSGLLARGPGVVLVFAATALRNVPLPGAPVVAKLRWREMGTILAERVRRRREAEPHAIVVVSLHWGLEGEALPRPAQTRAARALIDAGANVVMGHHPHVLQPIEVYRGGVILYSLGNLFFDFRAAVLRRGALIDVVLGRGESARAGWELEQLTVHPVVVHEAEDGVRPASGSEATRILRPLRERSRSAARTRLTRLGDTLVWQR